MRGSVEFWLKSWCERFAHLSLKEPSLSCIMTRAKFALPRVYLNIMQCVIVGASGAELKACCTEAGMFALRERRVHVTQEDFEMAVAKVMKKDSDKNMSIRKLWK